MAENTGSSRSDGRAEPDVGGFARGNGTAWAWLLVLWSWLECRVRLAALEGAKRRSAVRQSALLSAIPHAHERAACSPNAGRASPPTKKMGQVFDFRFFTISKPSHDGPQHSPAGREIVEIYSQKRAILGAMCFVGRRNRNGWLRLVPAARKCCCLEVMLLCRRTSGQEMDPTIRRRPLRGRMGCSRGVLAW